MKICLLGLVVFLVPAVRAADPLVVALRDSYQTMRLYLLKSAEMMPEPEYRFKLTPVSRTFGDWVRHTAEMNYTACANLRGIRVPGAPELRAAATKAELTAVLNASFEFCDPAFRGMTSQKLMTEITSGDRRLFPVVEMVGLTNSLHEHYGNLIGYLRSKEITPPSTLRTQRVLQ